jgi:uncharacterized protein YjbI with pentapeptide repeats
LNLFIDLSPDATTLTLPPLPQGAALFDGLLNTALILTFLALLILAAIRRARRPRQHPAPPAASAPSPKRPKAPRFHTSPGLNFLAWFAVPLTPIWLALLVATLFGLARLWWSFFFPDTPLTNTDLRWLALATVGLMTALAGLVGTPLALIRVFTTERQTRAAEENLTTGLINKAVEGLGAEKTVKEGGKERTLPNLEVRIGALYQLERIAGTQAATGIPQGAADHIRIMKILCAYIRENAPAAKAVDLNMSDWPDYPENASAEDLKARSEALDSRRKDLFEKIRTVRARHRPRIDIQTALEVIGRRSATQTAIERAATGPGQADGYRLDLSATNLQAADLPHLDLDRAILIDARMEGASLSRTRVEGANLINARMEGAVLGNARMKGAKLLGAWMEGTVLSEARMEGADVRTARMQEASLFGAEMKGANLSGARMERAVLSGAQMEGADLSGAQMQGAQMQGANLFGARMEGANLREARMEGAVLSGARMRSASWAGATCGASSVQFADLRGGSDLDQSRLSSLIGNAATLLPDTPDDEPDLFVPHKWASEPPGFDRLLATLTRLGESEQDIRARYLCAPGEVPRKSGTPWPLDADPPWGAQGPDEDDYAYMRRKETWADAQPLGDPIDPPAG